MKQFWPWFLWLAAAPLCAETAPHTILTITSGPITEFEVPRAVAVSEMMFDSQLSGEQLSQAIVAAGSQVIVLKNTVEPTLFHNSKPTLPSPSGPLRNVFAPHDSIWIRDYGPLPLRTQRRDGHFDTKLVDFAYGLDKDPWVAAAISMDTKADVTRSSILLDGGNYLTDGKNCFVAAQDDYSDAGLPIPETTFRQRLGATMGCPVIVIRDAPHPHIDMWLKILDHKVFVVNEITEESLNLGKTVPEISIDYVTKMKANLDRIAHELTAYGKVVRIPMPLPLPTMFRTYANGILIGHTAILPKFAKMKINDHLQTDYPDQKLLSSYETQVTKVFTKLGYTPILINADAVIAKGGAWHCVTTHIY